MVKLRLCVCGAKKLQGLNINSKPGLSFAGKISHQDAKQTICKSSFLELHLSGAQGWPHGPGAQSYTPNHKITFLSFKKTLL